MGAAVSASEEVLNVSNAAAHAAAHATAAAAAAVADAAGEEEKDAPQQCNDVHMGTSAEPDMDVDLNIHEGLSEKVATLASMGFEVDPEVLLMLLQQHDGDFAQVVNG